MGMMEFRNLNCKSTRLAMAWEEYFRYKRTKNGDQSPIQTVNFQNRNRNITLEHNIT